ncbi:hypothetical protein B296_00027111 [Ensete ventricosum]|uniref:Uncharacterized protein n=1 Tax=Ensete ventricosum TaxID=4639 RepID=A0A426YRC0_ENSVE|nr:hypothetical protein B296_00027111 [Ensete ventricosum]
MAIGDDVNNQQHRLWLAEKKRVAGSRGSVKGTTTIDDCVTVAPFLAVERCCREPPHAAKSLGRMVDPGGQGFVATRGNPVPGRKD